MVRSGLGAVVASVARHVLIGEVTSDGVKLLISENLHILDILKPRVLLECLDVDSFVRIRLE